MSAMQSRAITLHRKEPLELTTRKPSDRAPDQALASLGWREVEVILSVGTPWRRRSESTLGVTTDYTVMSREHGQGEGRRST